LWGVRVAARATAAFLQGGFLLFRALQFPALPLRKRMRVLDQPNELPSLLFERVAPRRIPWHDRLLRFAQDQLVLF
jgi:hypothetical protein